MTRSPTVQPPQPTGLASALRRNIDALTERRRREREQAPLPEKIADAITRFAGSMTFVAVHAVVFAAWTLVNAGWLPIVQPFDPTFVILGTSASCEAIFLSTFVLISQNRMAAASDRRADLDLQINLLTEHEVTKLVAMVSGMATKMGVQSGADGHVEELKQNVAPEAVLAEIESKAEEADTA